MSFALYLIGFVLVIGGVVWAMAVMNISATWIGITCLVLLGIGVMLAVKNERSRDRPS
jgi:hypothetical protein